MLSLACVDVEHGEPGTEVTVVWGEEGGGTSKPTVERHVQTEIRATVAPAPIAEFALHTEELCRIGVGRRRFDLRFSPS